jgi:hypothetical protein
MLLRAGAPPRQLQLVPVRAPPPGEEGRARECPVCLEETRSNAQWALFPCGHGTCRPCYGRLVAKPQQDAACPLCRAPLKEPVPGAPRPPACMHAALEQLRFVASASARAAYCCAVPFQGPQQGVCKSSTGLGVLCERW